ncbi:MAG TPA: tripartite tricarboxylate transporter substrate-binding protein, partial [Beijerinckiaceae bacterium]|nr:tripartite tricarboxylate transporter substrate-binding protein [Beijerinckiaceae bacterium]
TARAQSAGDFFKGKTIRLIVSTTPGGGYDIRARNMARHFGRYVPGNPQVVVDNMPGAGSLLAMNYVYNSAPRDGTVMCLFQHSIFATPFLTPGAVRFDLQKYSWLGSLGSENGVVAVRKDAPVQTTDELFTKDLITGMPAGVSVIPDVFNAILGTRMKIISGYPGNNEVIAALERGEVQAIGEWSWENLKTTKGEWVKSGFIRPLLQIGIDPAPDLPNVPLAQSFAKTNEDRRIIEIFVSQRQLAFPIVLPPDVPADRLAALRDAFVAMGQDVEFKEDQMRDGSPEPKLMAGADAAHFVDQTFGALPPTLARRINSFGFR